MSDVGRVNICQAGRTGLKWIKNLIAIIFLNIYKYLHLIVLFHKKLASMLKTIVFIGFVIQKTTEA